MGAKTSLIDAALDAIGEERWDDAIDILQAIKLIEGRRGKRNAATSPRSGQRRRGGVKPGTYPAEALSIIAAAGDRGITWSGMVKAGMKGQSGDSATRLLDMGLITRPGKKGTEYFVTPKGKREAVKLAREKVE